jgi:hypothetical protein
VRETHHVYAIEVEVIVVRFTHPTKLSLHPFGHGLNFAVAIQHGQRDLPNGQTLIVAE